MKQFINWIASYPKCGNTWVRMLLNAYYYGPSFHINSMHIAQGEPGSAYYRGMWTHAESMDIYDWACMRNAALRQAYAISQQECKSFFVKSHCPNLQVDDIPLISSVYTRKAVYIVRDPRDVLVSSARYFRNDVEEQWRLMTDNDHSLGGAEHQATFQPLSSYKMHLRSWLEQELTFPLMRIRYEELQQDAGKVLRDMLEFLDIQVDPDRLAFAVKKTRFDAVKKTEDTAGFRENMPAFMNPEKGEPAQFFAVGKSGQWQEALPSKLAKEVYNEFKDIEHLWT